MSELDNKYLEELNNDEHPLSRRWTLWYYDPNCVKGNKDWLELLQKIYTINSIENFWRLYNNIEAPSGLKSKANYFLFVDGIDPVWENDANRNGGKWTIEFDSKNRKCNVDHYWLYTLLGIIGASLPGSKHVLGIQLAVKFHKYRLSIWTKDALDENNNLKIGSALKDLWQLDTKMSYIPHDENIKLSHISHENNNSTERNVNILYSV